MREAGRRGIEVDDLPMETLAAHLLPKSHAEGLMAFLMKRGEAIKGARKAGMKPSG